MQLIKLIKIYYHYGKYGFAILNIEIDTEKVDCNVHPAKLEVRFEDEQKVFKAVYHAIKSRNEDISIEENQEEKSEFENKVTQSKVNEEVKKEEFKPRAGTFSGFFKKFINEKTTEKTNEKKNQNTLVEDLFQAKRNNTLSWGSFNDEKNENIKEEQIQQLENSVEVSSELLVNNKEEEKVESLVSNKQEEKNEIIIEDKEEEKIEPLVSNNQEEKINKAKLGNTIISSDTKESEYNMNDILNNIDKDVTVKIDTTNSLLVNNSNTEIVNSLKEIDKNNNSNTVIVNTTNVENEIVKEQDLNSRIEVNNDKEEKDTVTEKLLEQKAKNYMEDTQFIDTGKVRSELYKLQSEEVPITKDFADMYQKVFGMEISTIRRNREEENTKIDLSNNIQIADNIENKTVFQDISSERTNIKYRFIGTIFEDYAIIEVKDEMYMIEKNAAEERLMYEIVKSNFYDESNYESVTLLLADIVTLSPKEMSIARELLSMFRRAGFDYEEFGECTLKLTKVPCWAERLNTKILFLEILRDMDTVAVTATKEKEEKFISTISSKYVYLSNSKLSEKELEVLIKKLLNLPSPFMYPNGRLTAVKISKVNMEKKFSRR